MNITIYYAHHWYKKGKMKACLSPSESCGMIQINLPATFKTTMDNKKLHVMGTRKLIRFIHELDDYEANTKILKWLDCHQQLWAAEFRKGL